jgi:NADP-dependent 3-hydroxy acid dehydrogenase YdfG
VVSTVPRTRTDTSAPPWFITGASSGFDHAFATHALARGCNVVATARHVAKLQELVAEAPDRVLALQLDVDRSEGVKAAIAASLARFGRIDVLINNAGYGIIGAIEKTPEAGPRAVMETNFFGATAVTIAALAILRALDADATPLRLQLGGDAVSAVRTHAQTLLADLVEWKRVATNTRLAS